MNNKTKGWLMLSPFLIALIIMYAIIFGWYLPVFVVAIYVLWKWVHAAVKLIFEG